MFNTMKQMASSPRGPHQTCRDSRCRCSSFSKLFFFMATLSLAFTVLSIIVSFLPQAYYYLPIVLVPTLLFIVISLYNGRRRDPAITLGDNDPDKDDRERSYQLSMSMTGISFAGALGTLIGYHKNYSNRASHVYVILSIYFMLGAAVTCLFVLLLSRLLQGRNDWKKTAVGNAIVLGLLVLAVLVVAATFLGGVLAATPFPVAIAAAIWYVVEYNIVPPGGLDAAFSREEELKLMYTGAMTAMSLTFGSVMTTFAGFLGGEDKGGRLEVFIFFTVSCFVTSVSLGVVTFRAPKKASVVAAAIALGCLTMVLLVLAVLAMVSYVG
ncbi:hypothetical protein PVAP13_4NG297000 [Panicum virgatum]|uniref:Transmembrane protein n=1 Tax=Panicum virgatum TaxID=38727 RepID=A0A8T0TFJ3_PANVG|nr:hypothetical protein PVAP13_4NG297000 [Panicum virgatum]